VTRSSPRVLVINLHATENAGDAALLEMAIVALREALPGCSLTLAMNVPDARYCEPQSSINVVPSFIRATQPVSGSSAERVARLLVFGSIALLSALCWRVLRVLPPSPAGLRAILRAYAGADLVTSCPGNIFASTGKLGFPLLLSAVTVAIALAMGKPLNVLPQSIGPLRSRWERTLVGMIYRRARVVMVREPVSLRLAQHLGIASARLRFIPDLAYAYPAAHWTVVPRELRVRLDQLPHPLIGVTAVNRLLSAVDDSVWSAYEAGLAEGLTRFAEQRGASVVFFPQVTGPSEREDDRIAARRIAALMPPEVDVVLVDDQLSPGELKALYGRTDLFVGTRLHSVIFATGMGVPTLCVEYLSKTRGLAEMLGLERWRLDLPQVTGKNVDRALSELWEARAEVRKALQEKLPEMTGAVRRASELIRSERFGG
jgi:colanic acid/amylovoran biosynthesis protein